MERKTEWPTKNNCTNQLNGWNTNTQFCYCWCFRWNRAAAAKTPPPMPLIVCYFKQFDLYSQSMNIKCALMVHCVLGRNVCCKCHRCCCCWIWIWLAFFLFLEFYQNVHMPNELILRFLTVRRIDVYLVFALLFSFELSSPVSQSTPALHRATDVFHSDAHTISPSTKWNHLLWWCCCCCSLYLYMDNFHYRSFSCTHFHLPSFPSKNVSD